MWSIACEAAGGKEHETQKIRNRVCVGVAGSCLTIGTLCGTLASQPAFEAFAVGMDGYVRLVGFLKIYLGASQYSIGHSRQTKCAP